MLNFNKGDYKAEKKFSPLRDEMLSRSAADLVMYFKVFTQSQNEMHDLRTRKVQKLKPEYVTVFLPFRTLGVNT